MLQLRLQHRLRLISSSRLAGNKPAARTIAQRGQRLLRNLTRRPLLRWQGRRFGQRSQFADGTRRWVPSDPVHHLRDYAQGYREGQGLWKWSHYYDIYERHLAKFVGTDAQLVEIGVYSGGSLRMWRGYLGARCHIHGIDIAPECRAFEADRISVSIGDQADPAFWAGFLAEHPVIDIAIDDGGHQVDQQIATLQALLPRLSPGGVYICEDIAGSYNPMHDYVSGLTRSLDAWKAPDRLQSRVVPTPFQRHVASIHRYPYLLVIERSFAPPEVFECPRLGTDWVSF